MTGYGWGKAGNYTSHGRTLLVAIRPSPRTVAAVNDKQIQHEDIRHTSSILGSSVSKSCSKMDIGRPIYVETYLSIITQAYQILRRSCSSRGVNSDVPPCIH